MTMKKTVGGPSKVNVKTIIKLADAIQHSASVSDACRYAGISRDTYYRHYNNEEVFAARMQAAKADQNRLIFSSLTMHP